MKWAKKPPFMMSLTKTQNPKNFFHCRRKDLPSLLRLSSAIVGGDIPMQNTCQLLDFSLNPPAAKVLILEIDG